MLDEKLWRSRLNEKIHAEFNLRRLLNTILKTHSIDDVFKNKKEGDSIVELAMILRNKYNYTQKKFIQRYGQIRGELINDLVDISD